MPSDSSGCARRCSAARAQRVRPARDDKVVAAWNGLAISGLCAAGTLLARAAVRRRRGRRGRAAGHAPHRRRPAAPGLARRRGRAPRRGAGGPRLRRRPATSRCCRPPATRSGWPAPRRCSTTRWTRFRADDGGFFDTAADAEALVARPRDPSDNASPSGLSATVHALAEHAALTGSGRHREAAEEALATVASLARQAPRFAGWSLAAAQAMLDGPLEVAVVGPPGPDRDALADRARRAPGAVVLVADGPSDAIPLLAGRTPVDGRPAAYVCRHQVCDRPVTDLPDLDAALP